MTSAPRIAAIQDISGFGRCSMTVALPVLSAMGGQCCPLPTAYLSAHTAFPASQHATFLDMTGQMAGTMAHWAELGVTFDAIYSGFLGSEGQISLIEDFYSRFRGEHTLVLVDPVMGDHGKPYRTYTKAMQKRMAELVRVADLITPNVTEACILLGEEYDHAPLTRQKAKSMLSRLSEMGPRYVVITGVQMAAGQMANVGYDRERNAFWMVPCEYVPVSYPGTGDIYASVLVGAFLSGDSLPIAMDRATRFVELAIQTTFSYGSDTRCGVMLEKVLGWLTQQTVLKGYQLL